MDPKFVSLLIQEILNSTKCPGCGTEINPTNVTVNPLNNEQCLLTMQCSKCKALISASAQIKPEHKKIIPKNNLPKTVQTQSKIAKPSKGKLVESKRISLQDLMSMKKTLQNFSGNFNSLFK